MGLIPYIESKQDRELLDHIIKSYAKVLVPNGNLNYFLFALCKRHTKAGYNSYKNFRGELLETAKWIWWKFMVPYERTKEIENGDVA